MNSTILAKKQDISSLISENNDLKHQLGQMDLKLEDQINQFESEKN
jgi:hypothetical protein